MKEKIIEKVYSFLFVKKARWFIKNLWDFWNKKIRLFMLLQKGREKGEIENAVIQCATVSELFSEAKNETHLLLLELLVAIQGKMYLVMRLLCNPELELTPIVSDNVILEKLWQLQSLCQIIGVENEKVASLFYQVSFRDHIVRLREFIQDGDAEFLDLKAGALTINELCKKMSVPDVYKLVPDVASEEFDRLNVGKIKKTLTEDEVKIIWEKIYE